MKSLSDIGENEAIRLITALLPQGDSVITGPGDDCAVVRLSDDTDILLTSDPLIQGIHFTAEAEPEAIGHKGVARALSDIAAMGGEPAWALINITAPPSTSADTLTAITKGASTIASKHCLSIVGGDLAKGNLLELHAFCVGTAPASKAILRSGAVPDNLIFVSGRLGGSGKGKHLSFEPRIREGIFLRDRATSMIDISDGLATDIRHITHMSGVGASLQSKLIPVSEEADSLNSALTDGEDFELLFTLPESTAAAVESEWNTSFPDCPLTRIGSITNNKDIVEIIDEDGTIRSLTEEGYQHF